MTCLSNLAKTEVAISFICQHSFEVVEETIFFTKINKQWVEDMAPIIQFTLVSLTFAAEGLAITMFDPIMAMIASLLRLANELLHDQLGVSIDELLNDKLGVSLESLKDRNDGVFLPPLIGKAYKMISEKAYKEKHSGWKKHLVSVKSKDTGDDIWVKKEFEDNYF